jgi:hypothetical protein
MSVLSTETTYGREFFGRLPDGSVVEKITLSHASGIRIAIITLGAAFRRWKYRTGMETSTMSSLGTMISTATWRAGTSLERPSAALPIG